MAIYSGFFDAAFDERTGTYDREYDSVDFTGYFGAFVGSGVCVHGNDESMKVHLDTNTKKVLVNPGYLFIRGYWLKNTALYPIDLSGLSSGTHAIYAKLNLGKRMIEMGRMEKTEAYPDTLVLAYVTISDGMLSIEDTRSNTKICGLIDSSGSLSVKVEFALNYINTQVEDKLNQIEQNLKEQEKVIAGKIEEANSLIAKIAPPAIGTIKFSASQSIEEGWIPCDGRFVNERDYPELVAALGKLTPSGDKFKLLSDGEIGAQISNSYNYGGKLWVYSFAKNTLYGVDLENGDLTTIAVSSEHSKFKNFLTPTPTRQLTLSIVPHTEKSGATLFLSQIVSAALITGSSSGLPDFDTKILIFSSEFTGSDSSLTLSQTLSDIRLNEGSSTRVRFDSERYIPYIFSRSESGIEQFYCMCCTLDTALGGTLSWSDSQTTAILSLKRMYTDQYGNYQRFAFSPKNKHEAISMDSSNSGYQICSEINGSFAKEKTRGTGYTWEDVRHSYLPLNIAGTPAIILDIETDILVSAGLLTSSCFRIEHNLKLPQAARIFPDAGAYLFGKDIYMIFVGTGIIFFRKFNAKEFGYLDTTSVLGTITQYGYLDYSQDENTLYLVGQDTNNKVKVAKMVLNTLFDYANDGAWLPAVAADGVPAYIKAKEV